MGAARGPSPPPGAYRDLLAVARRFARDPAEAEDLLQDALLIAAGAGRDPLARAEDRRWLTGALRNRAAMDARGAARRKRRESDWAGALAISAGAEPAPQFTQARPQDFAEFAAWLETAPPAARRILVMALHGMDAAEIRAALNISPAAFRQRLVTARRALGALPGDLQAEALGLAYARRAKRTGEFPLGLMRRALLRRLRQEGAPARVGAHDPDGHLIVIGAKNFGAAITQSPPAATEHPGEPARLFEDRNP